MAEGIPPKFEGTNIPEDFHIPSCGIEDIDRAVFELFDKRLNFSIEVDGESKKVPVVFAAGERFALTRRSSNFRDVNNTLILPIISIDRGAIDFSPTLGGYGTPIATRDQISYTVKRRLSEADRDYQNIVNKKRLKNQSNVATRGNFGNTTEFPGLYSKPGSAASRRNSTNLSFLSSHPEDLFNPDLGNNIFEIITLPYPEFILIEYSVSFWTQYMQNMNKLLESMLIQFDGQEKAFQIITRNGYELVAYFQGQFSADTNFNDYTDTERVIKYNFNLKVPGPIIAPDVEGLPNPFRRFLSAPQIDFGVKQVSTQISSTSAKGPPENDINKFILSDVEEMDARGDQPTQRGRDGVRQLQAIKDPFTGKETKKFVKILTRNQRAGETVASSRIIVDLETINDTDTE
tara:strand:+ start:20308 stop:21519 length:1212 start_codon:yes stop_codon:yes gene_type:complete